MGFSIGGRRRAQVRLAAKGGGVAVAGSGRCIFCGTVGTMTGEDVLGQWLQRIDLDQSPVPHGTGWLNRIGREIGTRPPYRQRVRDVCGDCNSGWMSRLENTARRVLTPFILGKAGAAEGPVLGAVAAWAQKTCLTAMYVSTPEDRAAGYGLPAAEYRELYESQDAQEPLPRSQFWMGRFDGAMAWSVRVTPLAVMVDGLPEPEIPQGYLMTIVLGQLLLQGVRMTTPGLEVTAGTSQDMPRIWPGTVTARWPEGEPIGDSRYQAFALGRDLRVQEPHTALGPWKPATDLPASELAGDLVKLPTACGKHAAYYPSVLISEAMHGRFYAFVVSCDCNIAYLIHTEPDGAHCKADGDPADVAEAYAQVPGAEETFADGSVTFACKRLP
jgi:hypothetical protein